jgi:4'-phosphopantetheinyl transferase EntD
MLETLFPSAVVVVTASPEMWEAPLHPEEEVSVRRAVPKRRREFAAGRATARLALARLGIENFPLVMGPDRLPAWPEGIVGSISHCSGFCGAAVARRQDIVSLGLDVEPAEPLEESLLPLIVTDRERNALERAETAFPDLWSRIVFSAKESVYKCLSPLVRRILDFHEVELSFDAREGTFTARPTPGASPWPFVPTLEVRIVVGTSHLATGSVILSSGLFPPSVS